MPPGGRRRRVGAPKATLLALLGAVWLLGSEGVPPASSAPRPPGSGVQAPAILHGAGVYLLVIDGVISPLSARYLERNLRVAAAEQAALVVLRLDTPGGLEKSMRQMTQMLLGSPVPVAVYVAPPGARAASAGMFVTIAAHVAAMAPGTNIGAAHPVAIGGEANEVMASKAVQDAAALARAVATERGRNADWAERAVRESLSITAREALEKNVIDLVASDLGDLLRQLDGRKVRTVAGEITLRVADAPVFERPMSLPERILATLVDPNIAYLLFTLGMIGLIAELYNPGSILPGVSGLLAIILAFVAFGSLPINWAGVFLLMVALGLFIAELQTQGVGILAVGGTVAFVLGSLMLFTPPGPVSPALPAVRVSPWLITGMTVLMVGFFLLVLRAVVQSTRIPVATGIQALVGRSGVALSDLVPRGSVRVAGEVWSAESIAGLIEAGETVRVVGVEGVTLRVTRA